MIEKKLDFAGDLFFVDRETGAEYGNVVGGLAWPGAKSGFLVVAAIALTEDINLEAYPITIITEAGDSDSENLFKLGLKFSDDFSVDRFFGDTKDASMMEILNVFNRDRNRRRLKNFHLSEPPRLEEESNPFFFYLQLIRKYTRPAKKSLHFGPESIYPGYLLNLSTDEAGKAQPADHPCVAALGYALAVLTNRRNRKLPRATRYETQFDPFAPNYGASKRELFGGETMDEWDPFKE